MTPQKILEGLLALRELGDAVHTPELGICDNLSDVIDEECVHEYIHEYIQPRYILWPHFSGNEVFPVPHPDMPAESAYMHYDNLWDASDEYCKLRYDLLNFMIAEVEKDLGTHS